METERKHFQHGTCNELPVCLRTFSPNLVIFTSSYFCLSTEGEKLHGLSSAWPCTHRCNGEGENFWGASRHSSCCVLVFVIREIYTFLQKNSKTIKGFIKQKMSLRTQRGKTSCGVPRWTEAGWGRGMEVGLALKQSPFSAHGEPFMVGFGYSRKLRWVSGGRRKVYPEGTSVWYFPLVRTTSQGR